jgi:hypothetical protein
MWKIAAIALCWTAAMQSSAQALCSEASLTQEFKEADVVVRARLVSELNAWNDEPSAAYEARWGGSGNIVLYGLRVDEVFKGKPGPRIAFFEERNSGAFYLDIDKDYLLFLNYHRPSLDHPSKARGAMYMRYTCGQSKPWSEISTADLEAVRALSRHARAR